MKCRREEHTPRCLVALLLIVGLFLPPAEAAARPLRRLFEPTDLDLLAPGQFEIDAGVGVARGPQKYRVVLPDLELGLGVWRDIEIDLATSCSMEDGVQHASFNHFSCDNLWAATKAELVGWHDDPDAWDIGIGIQAGPKLPLAPHARGVGAEALLIAHLTQRSFSVALNGGGFVDPGDVDGHRSEALEAGLTLAQVLDAEQVWSISLDVGGLHYFGADPDEATISPGITYSATDSLDLSLSGQAGLTSGSDHYVFLLGISSRLQLW